MAETDGDIFTDAELDAIYERVTQLEERRLLGGEAPSVDESGAEVIFVMPMDDEPPLYAIRKRAGRYRMENADGATVVDSDRLTDILEALP